MLAIVMPNWWRRTHVEMLDRRAADARRGALGQPGSICVLRTATSANSVATNRRSQHERRGRDSPPIETPMACPSTTALRQRLAAGQVVDELPRRATIGSRRGAQRSASARSSSPAPRAHGVVLHHLEIGLVEP
jgi:hypothetical protein